VIVGDADGAVAIPKKIEKQVFAAVLAKVSCEKLAAVFRRYGIL